MPKTHIRKATVNDSEVMATINNEYIIKGGSSMETVLKTAEEFADLIKNLGSKESIWCLELDGEVVGWGIIKKYSERPGYSTTCETAIYLLSEKVRMGLGTQMKMHLINECRKLGYHHLVAKIVATNLASIEYNRKLGYEVVGTQREVGNIDGKWLDVTIMQLLL